MPQPGRQHKELVGWWKAAYTEACSTAVVAAWKE